MGVCFSNYCCLDSCCINTKSRFPQYDPKEEHDPSNLCKYVAGDAVYSCDPTKAMFIHKGDKGLAAREPVRLMDMFEQAVKMAGDQPALRKEYDTAKGVSDVEVSDVKYRGTPVWRSWTWQEYWNESMLVARALVACNLEMFQPVNILGFNSPHWHFADMGAILAGGIAAGIYGTNAPNACAYITQHSKARVVFVEDAKQLNKYLDKTVYGEIPDCKYIVMWNGELPADANDQWKENNELPAIITWATFIKQGKNVSEADVRARWANIEPGHCSTLIYTSGTTGQPKAVMASHDNMTWSCACLFESSLTTDGLSVFATSPNRVISYLPLSHIAAQMADIISPMAMTANYPRGPCCVTFARKSALKGTLKLTLCATSPTLFFGVPRVWEKFAAAIQKIGKAKAEGTCGCLIKCLGDCWKPINKAAINNFQVEGNGGVGCCYCFSQFMSNKIKGALGLTQAKLFITGAAPISMDTLQYMASLGIEVFNMYGMSETSALACGNRHSHNRFGTCGPSFKGVEVIIGENKEVLIRGRNIMMGYMYNEEKTKKTIDANGYLHSEDQGEFTDDLLSIVGRIKDLIIGAGGENIAPIPIEQYLESNMPAVSKVVMIGDTKKYNVMLVSLKCEGSHQEGFSTTLADDATEVDSNCTTTMQAAEQANTKGTAWYDYIENARAEYCNNKTVCEKNASKIQKFRVIPDGDFDMINLCIGPTLKLKRPVVTQKYNDLIESMYS